MGIVATMARIKKYNIDRDPEAIQAVNRILQIIFRNADMRNYEEDEDIDSRPREKIPTAIKTQTILEQVEEKITAPIKEKTKGKEALSEQDVLEIRRLASEKGLTSTVIATMFPTSARNVRNIVSRNTWKHI